MSQPSLIDAGLPVMAFFTTRHGGHSKAPYDSLNLATHVGDDPDFVEGNRHLLDTLVGGPVVYMQQTHSDHVAVVQTPGEHPRADAIITVTRGLSLAVLVADCIPILIVDLGSHAVGAIHAGRAGLGLGIIGQAVSRLRKLGGEKSATIIGAIGPAICGGCYEVPFEMREEIARRLPNSRAMTSWGTPSLDLPAAAMSALKEAGVEEVRVLEVCSFESSEVYSHRREGVTGRIAGVIRCE